MLDIIFISIVLIMMIIELHDWIINRRIIKKQALLIANQDELIRRYKENEYTTCVDKTND